MSYTNNSQNKEEEDESNISSSSSTILSAGGGGGGGGQNIPQAPESNFADFNTLFQLNKGAADKGADMLAKETQGAIDKANTSLTSLQGNFQQALPNINSVGEVQGFADTSRAFQDAKDSVNLLQSPEGIQAQLQQQNKNAPGYNQAFSRLDSALIGTAGRGRFNNIASSFDGGKAFSDFLGGTNTAIQAARPRPTPTPTPSNTARPVMNVEAPDLTYTDEKKRRRRGTFEEFLA